MTLLLIVDTLIVPRNLSSVIMFLECHITSFLELSFLDSTTYRYIFYLMHENLISRYVIFCCTYLMHFTYFLKGSFAAGYNVDSFVSLVFIGWR